MLRSGLLCVVAALALCQSLAAAEAPAAVPTAPGGVRVESVRSLVVAQSPALRPGDIIYAYLPKVPVGQPAPTVAIDHVMQWRIFEAGEWMRGPVTLLVQRGAAQLELPLADGIVDIQVRSRTPATPVDAADEALLREIAAGNAAAAEVAFDDALKAVGTSPEPNLLALISLHGARAAMLRFAWQQARDRLARALAVLPESMLRVRLLEADIQCTGPLREWRTSVQIMQAALPIVDREAPHSLAQARIVAKSAQIQSFADPKAALIRIEQALSDARTACGRCESTGAVLMSYGDVLHALDRIADAEAAFTESLDIARAITPSQYAVATRLIRVAITQGRRGQPELAEPNLREALALMQTLKMPELEFSTLYNALGTVASKLGDLQAARSWYEKSVEVSQRLAPNGIDGAAPLNNLAQISIAEGDFAAAERQIRQALVVLERAGNGPNLPLFLTTQAQLEMQRGNDEAAETILVRVRDLQTKINPDAEILGITDVELAKLYLRLHRIEESEAAAAQAIAIFEKLPGDGFALAEPLAEFGYAKLGLGQLDQAEAYFQRSFALYQTRSPDSLRSSVALQGAGETALARADYARAETLLKQALLIRRRDAPDSARVAQSLHALGRLALLRHRQADARALLCEAAEVLDRASLRSGGDDLGETRFRAQYADVYHDCLAATVDAGDADAALAVFERSRARGFRHALEQRRIHLARPDQQGAMAALEKNTSAYERSLARANDPALEASVRRNAHTVAAQLQQQRVALRNAVAESVPKLASAYRPESRAPGDLQSRLPLDTAYLAYSVGEQGTVVLALRRGVPIMARHIPIGRNAMATRVRALRSLIADQGESAYVEYLRQSDRLYRDLLLPLSDYLRGSRRLSISLDGALQDLPFAALWQADAKRFLIESYALTFVDALADVDHAPAARAPTAKPTTLLAVGDPTVTASILPEIGRRLRSAGMDAKRLPPLPAARREVQALAKRYPGRTRLLIGDAATEARVRGEAGAADQLHFAVHALFDAKHPLESALVLHPGAPELPDDDGLLQVWEIFEGLKLNADLVVLSGCDTAAGKDFAGEGLLGFSRAFAFAGARATVASLWPVEDESTAELMERFYAAHDANADDALALQQAMVEMIHARVRTPSDKTLRGVGGLAPRADAATRARRPYFWAAFQLYGH